MFDFVGKIRFPDLEADGLTADVKTRLAESMYLVDVAAFAPLFSQGADGDAMYVVVSGDIGMYINPLGRPVAPDASALAEATATDADGSSPIATTDRAYLTEVLPDGQEGEGDMSPEKLTPVYGSLVFVAGSGDAFGELSLVSDAPRAASAVAHGVGCQLASLSRAAWQGSLRSAMQQNVTDKMDVLRALPAFTRMDHAALQRLSYYFKPLVAPRRTTLFRQGDAEGTVYLVRTVVSLYKPEQPSTCMAINTAPRLVLNYLPLTANLLASSLAHT